MNLKSKSLLLSAIVCFGLVLTDCKKKEDPKEEETTTKPADESGQSGADSREAVSENDAAINDVNQVMSENNRVSGKPANSEGLQRPAGSICGLTIDSSLAINGVMILNYNGTTCNNRTRTGSIKLTLQGFSTGTRWKDQNAVIKVEYLGYKITRASDQASIKLNGTQYLTNVSGGNWFTFLILQSPAALVTSITGTNLNVTWHDNKTAIYNINRKITYTYGSGILTVKGEGIGSSNNLNNLENYGTTRDGDAFTSQVSKPVIWNTTCGGGAPLQGQVDVKVASKSFNLIFDYGVDINGNPVVAAPNTCPYGWKLSWTVNNQSSSKVIKYQ